MYRFALAFIWLLGMRAVLFVHSGVPASPSWLVAGDVAGAFVLLLLLERATTALRRWGLIAMLTLAFYASGQHLAIHGTLFRLAHLGYLADPVFVSSSVLTGRILMLPLYGALAWLLCSLYHRLPTGRTLPPILSVPAVAALVAGWGVAIPTLTQPSANVVTSMLAQVPGALLSRRAPPDAAQVSPVLAAEDALFFQRQTRGVPGQAGQPNVLMVMIEGLSAAYLPEVAAYHGLAPAVSVPALEATLRRLDFRVYRNVLSLQRQTNRGTYTLLCGAYPRVVTATPKMTDVAAGRARPLCLPALLRAHGYRTAYLQAAPLAFMDKDRFMPAIGFEQVHGAEYVQPPDAVGGWGASDGVFLRAAANWVRALDRSTGPWFAVLLTVGTHHPFPDTEPAQDPDAGSAVIAAMLPSARQAARQASFATMEAALQTFLEELDAAGVLDNALVIVTSDESGGFIGQAHDTGPLDGNFGMLAVRPPQIADLERFVADWMLVSTLDVPITIVDHLGLEPPPDFLGRSLQVGARPPERGLLAGDTYADAVYFLLERGELLACNEALLVCRTWHFTPDRLFGSLQPSNAPPFLELPARRRLVQRAAAIDLPAVPAAAGTAPRR